MYARYMGIKEISEYLGIKETTVYAWVFQKKIPHTKLGKLLKFEIVEIDQWLRAKRKEPCAKWSE